MVKIAKILEDAIKAYLKNLGYDVVEIVNYEEYTYYGGYCETCSYEEIRVKVQFKNADGTFDSWEHYGSLGDLFRMLESVELDY